MWLQRNKMLCVGAVLLGAALATGSWYFGFAGVACLILWAQD